MTKRTCHLPISLFALALIITSCLPVAWGQSSQTQVGIPTAHIGTGPIHAVIIDKLHAPGLYAEVQASGAIISEIDYESMVVCRINENRLGGREAMLALQWPIRDEVDLVALSAYILDANEPARTLLRLPIDETFGDPLAARIPANAGLYLVKMAGPPKDKWLTALRETGCSIVHYMAMNAYVVSCAPKNIVLLEEHARINSNVTLVLPMHPAWRMTPEVQEARQTKIGQILPITIQVINRSGIRETLESFRALSAVI